MGPKSCLVQGLLWLGPWFFSTHDIEAASAAGYRTFAINFKPDLDEKDVAQLESKVKSRCRCNVKHGNGNDKKLILQNSQLSGSEFVNSFKEIQSWHEESSHSFSSSSWSSWHSRHGHKQKFRSFCNFRTHSAPQPRTEPVSDDVLTRKF